MINTNVEKQLAQLAWVVKDINAAEQFFTNVMHVGPFQRIENFSVANYEAVYYGSPADYLSHISMTWSGGVFIELIQPVSGKNIFQDYLDQHGKDGLQHIAYRVPVAQLDEVIREYNDKGYSQVMSFNTPIAKIVFFDTYKELGVMTEIMGITAEGEKAVEQMKQPKK